MPAEYHECSPIRGTLRRIAGMTISRALLTSMALHLLAFCALLVADSRQQPEAKSARERFESLAIEATLSEEIAMSSAVIDSLPRASEPKRPRDSKASEAKGVQVQTGVGSEQMTPKVTQLAMKPQSSEPTPRREGAALNEGKSERAVSTGSDRTAANWKSRIAASVEGAWVLPPMAGEAIVCTLQITQSSTGEVLDARVLNCNGDDSVRQSISTAAFRASPLPAPPSPAQFEATLVITFRIE